MKIMICLSVASTLVSLSALAAQAGDRPMTAPRNPFAADSTQSMPHGDPAQQDATAVPGPLDESRKLREDEILYRHLGPGYIGGFTTSPYADGGRVLWTNGVNGLYKLDAEGLEIYDYIPSASSL